MMNEPIEELYFKWLCAKVMPPHSDNYNGLLTVLHRTEFVWVVPGDDNRAADGLELRLNFLAETHFYKELTWFETPCSVLEMLIGLCYRVGFQTRTEVQDWFWTFIRNLGLEECRRITDGDVPAIQEILDRFIWRNYSYDGRGGLFPLQEPHRDQRKIETWYQFGDYVEDQRLI